MKLAALKLIHGLLNRIIAVYTYFSILFYHESLFPAIRCMFNSIPTKLLVFDMQPLKSNLALSRPQTTPSMRWFYSNRVRNHLVISPKVVAGTGDSDIFFQRIKTTLFLKICCKGQTTFFQQLDIAFTVLQQFFFKVPAFSFQHFLRMPFFHGFFFLSVHACCLIILQIRNEALVVQVLFSIELVRKVPLLQLCQTKRLSKTLQRHIEKRHGVLKLQLTTFKI